MISYFTTYSVFSYFIINNQKPVMFYILGGVILFVLTLVAIILLKKNKDSLSKAEKNIEDLNNRNKDLEDLINKQKKDLIEMKDLLGYQKKQISLRDKEYLELKKSIDSEVLKKTSELHILLETSEENNKLKDAFLEKISREVRTPLNAILGFINLLNNPDLNEQDKNYYYRFIQESGNNLLSLIDNIIDFSKLETGELIIEPKKCRLTIMLSDLIDKYRSRLKRNKPNITMVFKKPETDFESLVDCKRYIHIANQLLSNAINFTDEGKISVLYEIRGDHHFFEITDTGHGIDDKYQDIIFDRFYQIEDDKRNNFSGAGLGLTLAKRLVELMGGTISVSSNLGEGSTFVFTVPFISTEDFSSNSTKISKDYNWKGKRILIAEDEESNYHFLEAILKKTQVSLLWASDGVEFLELINKHDDIDLVLLDIKMPGINGFNAIKVVRQQNITIPVIAQTAFNQPEDKQRCLDSGCNDYLSKPIDKDLLISKIACFFSN